MEIAGYLEITGELQGPIEGGSRRRGREGLIELLAFSHDVEIPLQQGSQIASGRAVHRPIEICKGIDKSSPKLMQAMCSKELLSDVEFSWYRFNEQGQEALYYKLLLKQALILKIKAWTPDAFAQDQQHLQFMETLWLGYESIIWSWGVDGNVEYETNWFQESR